MCNLSSEMIIVHVHVVLRSISKTLECSSHVEMARLELYTYIHERECLLSKDKATYAYKAIQQRLQEGIAGSIKSLLLLVAKHSHINSVYRRQAQIQASKNS